MNQKPRCPLQTCRPAKLGAALHRLGGPAELALLLLLAGCGPKAPPAQATAAPTAASTQFTYEQRVMAAGSYTDSGKAPRGEEVAREAIAQNPTQHEAHAVLGRALAMQNKLEDSAKSYQEAIALGNQERRTFVELSSVYDVSERYDEAVGVYQQWLAHHPNDGEMLQQLGLTYLLLRRPNDGASALQRALKAAPNDIQIAQDAGYALYSSGAHEAAATLLQKVVQADPRRHEAIRFLVQAKIAQSQFKDALEVLHPHAEREDPAGALRLMRARLFTLMGDLPAAHADYQALLQSQPDDAGVLLGAAASAIANGEFEHGGKWLQALEEKVGAKPYLLFHQEHLNVRRQAPAAAAQTKAASLQAMAAFARSHPEHGEAWRFLYESAKAAKNSTLLSEAKGRLQALGLEGP